MMQRDEQEGPRKQPMCLTPEEVGRVLGIGRTFVYDLLASGQLESIKLGRRRLVPVDAIERLIAEERQRQADESAGEQG